MSLDAPYPLRYTIATMNKRQASALTTAQIIVLACVATQAIQCLSTSRPPDALNDLVVSES